MKLIQKPKKLMAFKQMLKLLWLFSIHYGLAFNVFAETVDDPCGGASALLSIADRPTVGDSACFVPFKKAVLELGYQYQQLTHSAGYQQNFPEAELRIGLPVNNELVLVLPNDIHQSMVPHAGFNATTIGIKHEIGYTQTWLGALEALFTLPSGSTAFGSRDSGAAVNGIINYTFNSTYSLSFMFGVTTQTQSKLNGGHRFTSMNPDMVLSYVLNPIINFYGEVYGQSKTGPGEGSGFNFDGGVLYLPLPNLEVDLEVGQRISGKLNGFNHYIGTGMSIAF
jgi:hypothetical protein